MKTEKNGGCKIFANYLVKSIRDGKKFFFHESFSLLKREESLLFTCLLIHLNVVIHGKMLKFNLYSQAMSCFF